MTTPQQQVLDNCKAVFAKAKELYNLDLSNVSIRFDLKGRAAGMACKRGFQYHMRFNRDMLTREAFDHVLNNTVPHEIAHIVCFMNPMLGRSHDSGWARVCRQLGGTGATRHKEDVVYGKGSTYEYMTTAGHAVRVSEKIHRNVQTAGSTYTYRGGKGKVNKSCTYTIVGHQGRTLATPVVPKNTPVATTAPVVPAIVTQARQSFTIGTAPVVPKTAAFATGNSKASIARAIMLAGHTQGQAYESVIAAIMAATGHDRQLARATYKANMAKVGITI
jgi:predicted SprT family Zn-dependent metalloprotease